MLRNAATTTIITRKPTKRPKRIDEVDDMDEGI
jgi:hypothetical protein